MKWNLSDQAAQQIVNEAKAQGIHMPMQILIPTTAIELLEQAEEAYSKGVRGDSVTIIRNLGTPHLVTDSNPAPTEERANAIRTVQAENFPIPPHMLGDAPEMPRDLTALDDRSIRRLQSEYNAWLARVLWLLGCERSDENSANYMADTTCRKLVRELDKKDEEGRKKTEQVITAEVEADEELQKWRKRASQHKATTHILYSLRDIYSGHIDRLRNEWLARRDTFQQSGG